jgi:predicted cupin superfamily sugar epimerase
MRDIEKTGRRFAWDATIVQPSGPDRANMSEDPGTSGTPARALELVQALGLSPHPEGGHFVETFRAPLRVASPSHPAERCASTAIYFLLTTRDFSAFHRVRSDEVWHHYAGDALELHTLDAAGQHTCRLLGPNILAGERPQLVVPAGVLQAARPAPGPGGFVLSGCTVAPGFEFEDFEMPQRAELIARYPSERALVESLTR